MTTCIATMATGGS